MRLDKLRLSFVNKQNELGIMINNTRKSNYEEILDLFDSLYENNRESSNSFYYIEEHLFSEETNSAKYIFIKFKKDDSTNIELSSTLYSMLEGLLIDLSA